MKPPVLCFYQEAMPILDKSNSGIALLCQKMAELDTSAGRYFIFKDKIRLKMFGYHQQ